MPAYGIVQPGRNLSACGKGAAATGSRRSPASAKKDTNGATAGRSRLMESSLDLVQVEFPINLSSVAAERPGRLLVDGLYLVSFEFHNSEHSDGVESSPRPSVRPSIERRQFGARN